MQFFKTVVEIREYWKDQWKFICLCFLSQHKPYLGSIWPVPYTWVNFSFSRIYLRCNFCNDRRKAREKDLPSGEMYLCHTSNNYLILAFWLKFFHDHQIYQIYLLEQKKDCSYLSVIPPVSPRTQAASSWALGLAPEGLSSVITTSLISWPYSHGWKGGHCPFTRS